MLCFERLSTFGRSIQHVADYWYRGRQEKSLRGKNPNHPKADQPTESSSKLTTVLFIWSVRTIIVCVTDPVSWDAQVIVAGEGGGWASRNCTCGAILLITAIYAVIVFVTAPLNGDALSTADTGESPGRARIIYKQPQRGHDSVLTFQCSVIQSSEKCEGGLGLWSAKHSIYTTSCIYTHILS